MQTRSSLRLVSDQTSNPTSSTNPNLKGRNRRRSKKRIENLNLEEHSHPVVTMADQRTMAELLLAPTEGYAEAIVVPPILAEQFELKHSLINMMTTDQFFGLEKDNPHDHIHWFNKITSTIKYKDVPSSAIKLMLFPFSLAGASRRWLEKEPPHSIYTWEDLVLKFINEFFPPSRTINLRNEILNFQQRFDESFHEAWDRYKDLLRACPHHGFTELHQLDTFYNALNPADQDSLNAATGGNLLERRTQDVMTIIENKSKVRNSRSKSVVSQVKACDVNSNSSSEIAKLTHAINQQTSACLATGGNTFPELRDNIQGYVSGAAVNYDKGNPGYRPPDMANQIQPSEETFTDPDLAEYTIKVPPPSASLSNQTNEIKNMMASLLQMNSASTSGSGSLLSNTVASLKGELKASPLEVKMLKALMSNKEKLQELINTPLNENCSVVILKKLPEKLRDPGKFLIPYGFSELKCKALAYLGASINLMPLCVWKKLGLPELISTRMTLELANRAICTPTRIARDVFVLVGKFTFPVDFVIVDYESDPRVPLILGRPFLQTARALIDVHGEELILHDGDERLTLNMRHDTSSYSNQPHKESINLINFDIEFDLKEIEFLLYQDKDSSLKESIDQKNLVNLADIFVDSIPEMFTDEHALDYLSPLIFDEYDDDFIEVESDAGNDFSRVDGLPSTNNEDKIFNPCVLIQEKPIEIITRVVQDKKLAISNASLVLEDFDPPFYEPLFFKEVPKSKMLLPFSSENKEKVFKPGIHTSEKVHSSFILELSHQGYKVFKIN
nr:reverse transcriptase domain-containing protein [Tanacetum cinerariifolium]